jgi:hypothetical protein
VDWESEWRTTWYIPRQLRGTRTLTLTLKINSPGDDERRIWGVHMEKSKFTMPFHEYQSQGLWNRFDIYCFLIIMLRGDIKALLLSRIGIEWNVKNKKM